MIFELLNTSAIPLGDMHVEINLQNELRNSVESNHRRRDRQLYPLPDVVTNSGCPVHSVPPDFIPGRLSPSVLNDSLENCDKSDDDERFATSCNEEAAKELGAKLRKIADNVSFTTRQNWLPPLRNRRIEVALGLTATFLFSAIIARYFLPRQ